MTGMSYIRVKGARVHNLKNIDVSIPRDKLVVLTGLSGSGKSSLAFDTIYAEGQRRYVESLSSYARQFLEMQDKPDVDLIEGLSPAISIEQKTTSKNPRSTVATVTEIYDYLRLFYARVGKPFCYNCGDPIEGKSASQIIDEVMAIKAGSKISVLSPIVRERKGEYRKEIDDLRKQGFARVRIDGQMRLLDEDIALTKNTKHSIDIVVDRVVVEAESRMRVADAIELALRKAEGLVIVLIHESGNDKELLFSEHFSCKKCGISYPEIEPRTFSFNAPQGACETCTGLGQLIDFDPQLVVANPDLSIRDGAITPWSGTLNGYYFYSLKEVAKELKFSVDKPFSSLTAEQKKGILFGTRNFEGVIPSLRRRHKETDSDASRESLEKYMISSLCPQCKGARLRKEARFIKIANHSIDQLTAMSVGAAKEFINSLKLDARDSQIAAPIIKEVASRLEFLNAVGLEYLTLDRNSGTLSGGEAQRIRLATQIGSALVGVLYVLDEPSIGLHQRDNERLLNTLRHLRDLGNCVLVVEHDEETIFAADHVIDMGPFAGRLGGEIVSAGTPAEIMKDKNSLTGKYLSRELKVEVPASRRASNGKSLQIIGARGHNLQNVNLNIPLGNLVCVTGVSGSGKSSLVVDTLHKALAQAFHEARERPLPFKDILGLEHIDKVIDIDQSPIGRTPRSNPVTYAGVFDDIRKLFSELPDAKVRGYDPGRFSFNVKGGRCESCAGGGVIKIEMNFLPDVYVTCEFCKGKRFNNETLSVLFKGKNISEVLDMTVDDAREFFSAIPSIERRLETIQRVGLGYIHLGQQATTLSGGEAQRIKLSKELSKRATGKTLYILDEPTTGLHFHDVKHLIEVLNELVEQGNTVLVIEHNLDVIKVADHVIDLGPEGGNRGGQIVVEGTPETVARHKTSHTGRFLREILERDGKSLDERQAETRKRKETIDQVKGSRAKKNRIHMGS